MSVSFQTTKITLDVVVAVINKILAEKVKEKTGKQSLKDLRKKGVIQEVDLTENSLKQLRKFLRKYNIDYSILKDKTCENTYSLFFRNYDAEILEKAMQNFVIDKFKNKESIKNRIEKAKAKSKEKTQEKKVIEKNSNQCYDTKRIDYLNTKEITRWHY